MRLFNSLLFLSFFSMAGWAANERPNVILIFTDDHGYTDLGIHGVDPDVRTPHLDQLARDGVLFTNAYVTAPQCVPSRAGLLAGRHQNAFGVDDNHKGPLPLSETTIADRLQEAGYVTGMVGKWHLNPGPQHIEWDGPQPPGAYNPRNRGFEEYWNGAMNRVEINYDLDGNLLEDAPRRMDFPDKYRIDLQTAAALAFLSRREQDDRPFFLYLPYYAPHAPLEDPPHYMERLEHVECYVRRMGLASILAMDDGVGLIRKTLESMGIAENTLIFFTSDNGAPLKETSYVGSLNSPTVGEKGMQTDGGQRVPYIAAWPGTIPGGQVFEEVVSSLDAAFTTLVLAQAPMDDSLEGENLLPWLIGERTGPVHEALYWRWRSQAAVLSDGWKFIRLGDDPKYRYLFNMREIGQETAEHNRIDDYPEITARLERMLEEKADSWHFKGLPEGRPVGADQLFYDQHVEKTLPPQPLGEGRTGRYIPWVDGERRPDLANDRPPYPAGRNRVGSADEALAEDAGWLDWELRRGSDEQMPEGGWWIAPGPHHPAPTFITALGLDLAPPVRIEVEGISDQQVKLEVSWRTEDSGREFLDEPEALLEFPGGYAKHTARARVEADATVIHLRLSFPVGSATPLEFHRILVRDADGNKWINEF